MDRWTRRDFIGRTTSALVVGGTGCRRERDPSDADVLQVVLNPQIVDRELDGLTVRLRGYNGVVPGPPIETRPGQTLKILLQNLLPPYDPDGVWDGDHNVPHLLHHTNLHVHGLEVVPHLFDPVGTSDPQAMMISVPPSGGIYAYELQLADDQPPGFFWYHPHHHGSTAVQAISGMAGGIVVRGDIDELPAIAAAREFLLVVQDIGLFPNDRGEVAPDGSVVWEYEPIQNAIWQTGSGTVTVDGAQTPYNGGFTTGDYRVHFTMVNGEPVFREDHEPGQIGPSNPSYDPQNGRVPVGTPVPLSNKPDVHRFEVAPGEVVRFRMLNGQSDLLMPVVVLGHELYVLAIDGVNFDRVCEVAAPAPTLDPSDESSYDWQDHYQVLLAPANRVEFMIRASATPGVYGVWSLFQDEQFIAGDARLLAEIVVLDATPVQMDLPDELPPATRHQPPIAPSEIVQTRHVTFAMRFPGITNPVVGLDFLMSGMDPGTESSAEKVASFHQYDETRIDQRPELGTAEEWVLSVVGLPATGAYGAWAAGSEGHPFHIHVNSFEVVETPTPTIGPGCSQPPEQVIQDTVWVPASGADGSPAQVRVRMRFQQWVGKAVHHCHILPHEDTGMMMNFLIE